MELSPKIINPRRREGNQKANPRALRERQISLTMQDRHSCLPAQLFHIYRACGRVATAPRNGVALPAPPPQREAGEIAGAKRIVRTGIPACPRPPSFWTDGRMANRTGSGKTPRYQNSVSSATFNNRQNYAICHAPGQTGMPVPHSCRRAPQSFRAAAHFLGLRDSSRLPPRMSALSAHVAGRGLCHAP